MTEKIVKDYIVNKTKLDEREVVVKSIETKYERGDNKCFQVGAKFELKDQLYQKNFWPKGVAYRRFRFNFSGERRDGNSFLGLT